MSPENTNQIEKNRKEIVKSEPVTGLYLVVRMFNILNYILFLCIIVFVTWLIASLSDFSSFMQYVFFDTPGRESSNAAFYIVIGFLFIFGLTKLLIFSKKNKKNSFRLAYIFLVIDIFIIIFVGYIFTH